MLSLHTHTQLLQKHMELHINVWRVADMSHPQNLQNKTDAKFIRDITKARKLHVCMEAPKTGRYRPTCKCKGCKALMYAMCSSYHINKEGAYWDMSAREAQTELAMRLVFEVVFGFRPLKHVTQGLWHLECGKTKKCKKHHVRVKDLLKIALSGDVWHFPFMRYNPQNNCPLQDKIL